MHSTETDRLWIFASVLFAIFLCAFSWLAFTWTGAAPPQPAGELAQEPLSLQQVAEISLPTLPHREFLATAYSDLGITKSGVVAAPGIVAADPKVLPLGSIILVEAGRYSGLYTVMDTGHSIKGHKIDIYIPDYEEAITFGARRVAVRVLRHGWTPQAPEPSIG